MQKNVRDLEHTHQPVRECTRLRDEMGLINFHNFSICCDLVGKQNSSKGKQLLFFYEVPGGQNAFAFFFWKVEGLRRRTASFSAATRTKTKVDNS